METMSLHAGSASSFSVRAQQPQESFCSGTRAGRITSNHSHGFVITLQRSVPKREIHCHSVLTMPLAACGSHLCVDARPSFGFFFGAVLLGGGSFGLAGKRMLPTSCFLLPSTLSFGSALQLVCKPRLAHARLVSRAWSSYARAAPRGPRRWCDTQAPRIVVAVRRMHPGRGFSFRP